MTELPNRIRCIYDSGQIWTVYANDQGINRLRNLGMVTLAGKNDILGSTWEPTPEVYAQARERCLLPSDLIQSVSGRSYSMERYPLNTAPSEHYGKKAPRPTRDELLLMRVQRISLQLDALREDLEAEAKT
jgi:hypothetical protein